tara:strand:- start:75 stop:1094 length:1020 start_codon:yes stop_codon:yes gene_type:complete
MSLNSNSSLLITGGTGSFGKAFLKEVIKRFPNIKRIVIFSRDELKQWEMKQLYPSDKFPQIRFFIGDVRDQNRLKRAFEMVDIVIHAAALKQVPAAEYNPSEFIKTNVIGAENIVQASLETNVQNVIALSTDKAAAPVNLYGATKLCSDKLFVAANNISGSRSIKFSVVRYGNVMGSRGSVIPFFLKERDKGSLPITDFGMTRFNITLKESVDMVINCLSENLGGEIFVPKIPSYRIVDVAEAIAPSCEKVEIGIRPGEKIHEEMITSSDSYSTIDLGNKLVILPNDNLLLNTYKELQISFKNFKEGESYNSGSNQDFLSVDDIRSLIKQNIDINFKPY